MRIVSSWTLAASIAASACTLLVSTSDLEGKAEDGGAPAEASAPPDVATPPDASAPDARFCASRGASTICADFDDEAPLSGWTDLFLSGGSVRIDGDAVSAPAALLGIVPATVGTHAAGRIRRDLPFVPSTFHAELDVKACDESGAELVEYFKLEMDTPFEDAGVGLKSADIALVRKVGQIGINVEGYSPSGTHSSKVHPFVTTIAAGWRHFAIDLSASGPSATLRVVVDAQSPPALDAQVASPFVGATAARIIVGAFTAEAPLPCAAPIDNVVVDATP